MDDVMPVTDQLLDDVRLRGVRHDVAVERVVGFAQQFGEAHLTLACHAAFPLVLTPDLLYRLWANFVPQAPWTAVADVLLSPLCREVGHELYEMDVAVRNLLLKELKGDERFGHQHLNELADFLTDYVAQQLYSDDSDVRDLAQAQRWTALAYTRPGEAARELALALSELVQEGGMGLLQVTLLAEIFAEPLAEFRPLLIYTHGIENWIRGDLENATIQFNRVLGPGHQIQVAGVSLPIPKQIFKEAEEVVSTPETPEPLKARDVTLKLQPRRFPEPGRPFVNRGSELKLIGEKLDVGIQGKLMPSVVTCFWGAFGMGKSWLLRELERRYKYAGLKAVGSHPTIAARLDLNREILPALWRDDQLNREQLIRELWKQLASQIETDVPDLRRASADEWAEAFVNEVTMWSARSATPLIMLDTVDDLVRLDERTFFWLEQHLVERLAMTDRVLFVFTSRGALRRWQRFQVRRRVDLQRLTAFDAKTAGEEVKANPAVSEALYHHAFGHPLFTEWLGTALENQGINLRETGKVERLIEPSLVQTILREMIGEILKTVPELPAKLARYVSVLRWVSVEPLRFLAENMDLVEPGRGDAYYLDALIAELQAHHLLYWNSNKNTYEPDPVLRRLLAYFLELDEPTRFYEAHLAAFDFHRSHLSEYPQYLARYVPELAYHHAILDRCEPREAQPPILRVWWEQFLSEQAPAHPEPWAELVEALEQDAELRDVLPVRDYELLYSDARRRGTKPADSRSGDLLDGIKDIMLPDQPEQAQDTRTVTWLHISDLHWRESQAYDSNLVARALLGDLANRTMIAPQLAQIDFIFVTGDVAFSGHPEEYRLARQFFADLLRTTGVPKSRLFIVPGNHDVDRSVISDQGRDIVNEPDSRQEVNSLLSDEISRAIVMQRFHGYQEFINDYLSKHLTFDSLHYFYVRKCRVAGKQMAILGLNSAWASTSDIERHKLLLGERQVRAALDGAQQTDIRIGLMHHPFECLRDFDRDDSEPLLFKGCNFVLHGHLHRTGMTRLQAPPNRTMIIGAGACYDTLEYPNAYNLVHLDLSLGKGTIYLRAYSDRKGGFWTKDFLTYPEAPGEYTFDLPVTMLDRS